MRAQNGLGCLVLGCFSGLPANNCRVSLYLAKLPDEALLAGLNI